MSHPIHIKGQILKTPQGNEFKVPTSALQKAIEEEWSSSKVFHYQDKPLTALVATAIDKITPQREKIIEGFIHSLESDLLLFWASEPPDLYQLQQTQWLPLINWFNQKFELSLLSTLELEIINKIEISIYLKQYLKNKDIFHLTSLSHCLHLTGSLILGCAFLERKLKGEDVVELVNLHESFQQQTWGSDSDRMMQEEMLRKDLSSLENFLKLLNIE